jgi:hypothetical protein
MKFLYPAPLSSLESIWGSFAHFQAKHAGKLRWKGFSMPLFFLDLIFLAIGVAAFAVTALYLNACASL